MALQMMIYRMRLREIFEDDLTIELLEIKERNTFTPTRKNNACLT
jgi:hypothetical protein